MGFRHGRRTEGGRGPTSGVVWHASESGSERNVFNCHLADGLNQLMDEEWTKMWAVYVDAAIIHGQTKWHCEQRQVIFRQCMKALGKRLSEKGDRTVKEYGMVVGLKITAEGIEPDDGVITSLLTELRTRPK